MKSDEKITMLKELGLILVLAADIILIHIAFHALTSDEDIYFILLIIFGPIFFGITFMIILEDRARAFGLRNRKVMPLSYYDSIQDRAQSFLKLKVPVKNIKLQRLKRSNVTKYIEIYAKTGKVELTETERTKLSLVILETGISSQEPGEKSYYERERVAILENILAEKINN